MKGPKFTQQHFVEAADAIGVAYARCSIHGGREGTVRQGVRILQDELILKFTLDNPKFDHVKFREAIGKRTVSYRNEMRERGWE